MKTTSLVTWLGLLAGSIGMSAYADMVLIPAGSFTMGDTFSEGYASELPLHSATVSPFYMESVEVTKAKWDEVYAWAASHGYRFDETGSGKGSDHPVQDVCWYDCLKWCNARSEKEGLTPCYYTSSDKTMVYRRLGQECGANDCVDWSASGYRLPTEAEWERAARGGSAGRRFPWSDADTISHARANFKNDGLESYATGTIGCHPAYTNGGAPCTSPVGAFEANGYGLYDMTGNVWEWCWDGYEETWYADPGATATDTRGPVLDLHDSGLCRVFRGGGWNAIALDCRNARRFSGGVNFSNETIGFRCVRSNLNAPVPVIGPQIKANGATGLIIEDWNCDVSITVEMNADVYAGTDVDWWIIALVESSWFFNPSWFYMNNSFQWIEFDGNLSKCHPVLQGGLFDLPATEVLSLTDLPVGSYTFWFAIDYPMDGILNVDGQILVDAVNVVVEL